MSSLFDRPLNKPLDEPLPNTIWTIVRAFLCIAAFLGLLAAVFMLIASQPRTIATNQSSRAGAWWLAALITTPLIMAMMLAAAISSFIASRGGKALADLRTGNYFVRWDYDAATWAAYSAGEGRTIRAMGWMLAVVVLLIGILISFGLSVTPDSVRHKTQEIIVFAVCDIVFVATVVLLSRFFGRCRQAALQRRPMVIVGPDAVYCGGDLLFWNAGGNALYSARLLAPDSRSAISQIELVIGLSRKTRNIARATDAALHLTGHIGLVSSYRVIRKIPVPRGQEQLAGQICRWLTQNEPAVARHQIGAVKALFPAARPALKPMPAPIPGRTEARCGARWWKMTSSMIATGASMFAALVFDEMRTGGHATKVALGVGSVGACIALAAVIPLTVAVLLSVRDLVNRT